MESWSMVDIFVSRVSFVVVGEDSKSTDAICGKRTTTDVEREETTCETDNDQPKNSQR
jgi:hypothetical protein